MDELIERVVSAYRARRRGRVASAPAWHDLDQEGRVRAFEQTVVARRIEAALDPDGASTTVHAVLDRIRGGSPTNDL